ncbi:insulinase family protein [Burkholderiales bacterium]|nr:insulinase family protein [Burkholderiales bacterium]
MKIYLSGHVLVMSLVTSLLSAAGVVCAAERSESSIFQHTLTNGLEIIVKSDHRSPVAAIMLWYRAGSIDEVNGRTGIAHLLEHMMFQGTDNIGPGEHGRKIAATGGRSNAFTSTDYTGYLQELHSSELELAMKLEADRMQNLLLRDKEFNNELRVVMEERRQRVDDNPRGLLMEQLAAAMYVSHPYRTPIVGWMSDLEHLTIDDAADWHRRWYVPNNAALVIVGDVEPENVVRLAQKYFGNIESKLLPVRKPQKEPARLGSRRITVQANTTLRSQIIAYPAPKLADVAADLEPYALYLLAGVLDGHSGARLHKRLVLKEKVAHSVSVSYDGLRRGPGAFYVSFSPVKGHTLTELEAGWNDEVLKLIEGGVSDAELNRVKAQVIAGQVFSGDSVLGQASRMGRMWAIGFAPDAPDAINEKLKAITPLQVQEVAKKYLVGSHTTTAILEPKISN